MLEEWLRAHVSMLSAEIGERHIYHPRALHAAADYIRSRWSAQGYEVASQTYQLEGVLSENIEVTRAGAKRAGEICLVGAHYDTVPGSPGANDNASGVAALIEMSRLFTELVPATTVRFVACVNEVPPYFFSRRMGSAVYARAAKLRGDDIRLMISLETLGCYSDLPGSQHYPPLFKYFYPDQANFIAFVSNLRSRGMLRSFAKAFRANSDFPAEDLATWALVPGVAWSDHLSFWREGYPALMVTDTALYRYRYYHTALDTADKLDYRRFAQVTEGLYRALAALSGE